MRTFFVLLLALLVSALVFNGCGGLNQIPTKGYTLEQRNLTNMFPVDGASLRDSTILRELVFEILNEWSDSTERFRDLVTADWVIVASSDERKTASWPNGNTGLSKKRLEEVERVVRGAIESYHYPDAATPELVQQLEAKQISFEMPVGGAGEQGVTYLTDLTNNETDKPFTTEEVAKLSFKNREALYDSARFVRIEIRIGTNTAQVLRKVIQDGLKYEKFTTLVDNSGSMESYVDLFAVLLDSLNVSKKNLDLYTFSNGFDNHKHVVKNQEEINEFTKNFIGHGSGDEKVFFSTKQYLHSLTKDSTRQRLIVMTDEGIQDFRDSELEQIMNIAKEKKVDIVFLLLWGDQAMPAYPEALKSFSVKERQKRNSEIRNIQYRDNTLIAY